ncbi:MAG: DUF2791 family P-loop domain-containing protein [Syntrophaceae bacterium]|nr:DUF2791 family P-loop domain-containing protein [Syntrophaceae bacterium]
MSNDKAFELWARLGEEGKPPTELSKAGDAVNIYSVGIDPWIERLSQTYLDRLCRSNAHFKLVIAPYGGGKTHFLVSLGAKALNRNYAVSYVGCSENIRFDNSLEVYRSFISGLTLPGIDGAGLSVLLQDWIAPYALGKIRENAPDPEAATDMWINHLYRKEYPEPTFARVSATAISEIIDPDRVKTGDAAFRWLRGEIDTLTRDERSLIRVAPVPPKEQNEFGRRMLLSMCKFIKEFGLHGSVILFDEVETLFNAKGKALLRVLSAMRVLIDLPVGVSGGVPLLAVFSAVPDVIEQLGKYPALQQRLAVVGASFREDNNFAPQIDLSELGSQREFLNALGAKLIKLGELALGHSFNHNLQSLNIARLADVATNTDLDVNARRLFVKACVSILNQQLTLGEKEFSESELNERYRGSFNSIRSSETEEFEL